MPGTSALPRSSTSARAGSQVALFRRLRRGRKGLAIHSTTPSLHRSIPPPLHHSIPPLLHYSITPLLHYSITPPLHYSTAPLLHRSITPSAHYFIYPSESSRVMIRMTVNSTRNVSAGRTISTPGQDFTEGGARTSLLSPGDRVMFHYWDLLS
jgi:hypothetical protein